MPVPSLPTLTVAKAPDKTATALVVGYGADGVVGAPSGLDREYGKRLGLDLSALAASVGAKSEAGHTRTLPAVGGWPVVVVVGLGTETPTPEDLRQAAGAGVKQAAKHSDGNASIAGRPRRRRARDGAGGGRGRLARQLPLPPASAPVTNGPRRSPRSRW